jgi:hypothetical protein
VECSNGVIHVCVFLIPANTFSIQAWELDANA